MSPAELENTNSISPVRWNKLRRRRRFLRPGPDLTGVLIWLQPSSHSRQRIPRFNELKPCLCFSSILHSRSSTDQRTNDSLLSDAPERNYAFVVIDRSVFGAWRRVGRPERGRRDCCPLVRSHYSQQNAVGLASGPLVFAGSNVQPARTPI
jgi:hypothetical protein